MSNTGKYYVMPLHRIDKLNDSLEDAIKEIESTYLEYPYSGDKDARLVLRVERIVYPSFSEIKLSDVEDAKVDAVLEENSKKRDEYSNMFNMFG